MKKINPFERQKINNSFAFSGLARPEISQPPIIKIKEIKNFLINLK